MRHSDIQTPPGTPPLPEEDRNLFINLEPDTRAETDKLFAALSEGGTVGMELQEMFWGGYFGSLTDKFGVQWMFNCANA